MDQTPADKTCWVVAEGSKLRLNQQQAAGLSCTNQEDSSKAATANQLAAHHATHLDVHVNGKRRVVFVGCLVVAYHNDVGVQFLKDTLGLRLHLEVHSRGDAYCRKAEENKQTNFHSCHEPIFASCGS